MIDMQTRHSMLARRSYIAGFAFMLAGILSAPAHAQLPDSSGNGTIKGPYFVRQVLLLTDYNTGAIQQAVSIIGTMTFDGNGNYSFTGQMMDSSKGSSSTSYTAQGQYTVASNGLAQIENPIDTNDTESGLVAAPGPNAILASDTESANNGGSGYNDIFVAIPAGSNVSNTSISGTYQAGYIDFLQANAGNSRNAYFTLTSNGQGSFGNVTVNGAAANLNNTNTTQSLTGVTYNITQNNGGGTIQFPASSTPQNQFISGQKTFYVSADGNLILGGSPSGFDLLFAFKGLTGPASNSTAQGLYYFAGLENDASGQSGFNANIDSFYGSENAGGAGTSILHIRLEPFLDGEFAYDLTTDSTYTVPTSGTFQDQCPANSPSCYTHIYGLNGQGEIQVGIGPQYSLIIGLRAKTYTGSGVFLNPVGIINSANNAPITNSVAPGEFVSLYGTGLSAATLAASTLPLPTNLGGVQVTVNGTPAPLVYVSSTQINVLVPQSIQSDSYATFQVVNNGTKSNSVSVYTSGQAPGVFTANQSGTGPAAVLHSNYSPVTASNPAKVGETLQLFVTGLGSVTPAVSDGAAAPSNPLSKVDDQNLQVFLDGVEASVSFAGLAPGFAGLYQINFVVPSGVTPSSNVYVDVSTTEAYTTEATIRMQ